MALNKSNGNMYEFVTHTWNTVKGKCPHGCTYCYMRRWGKQNPIRFDRKELNTDLGSGNFIFVGSSCDMFARSVPVEWIVKTLTRCEHHTSNRYLFQSKDPYRIGIFPQVKELDSVICTTIETNRIYPDIMQNSPAPADRARAMNNLSFFDRYVTIEPIMDFDLIKLVELIRMCQPLQVNIGANTSHNVKLPEPSYSQILELVDALSEFTTVHKKRNLERLEHEQ